jgi:hypothetical protein
MLENAKHRRVLSRRVAGRSPRSAYWLYGAAACVCIGLSLLGARALFAPRSAPDAAAIETRLCARGNDHPACRAPREIEALLRAPDLEIEHGEQTASGRQNARLLTLVANDAGQRTRFRAKWRALSTAHGLNDPRKEIIAYEVQKLFLPPEDFVVPPAVTYCLDLDAYKRRVDARAAETFPRTHCVFGTLSYWLENAKTSGTVLDREQFKLDPLYRRTLADTNLLLFLTSNGDTHQDQFVSVMGQGGRRVYFVDFTISLSTYRNPTLSFDEDWSNLHVPLVPANLERLRRLSNAELERLTVVEQYERTGNRLFRREPTRSSEPHPDVGLWWSHEQLRIGMTAKELDLVRERSSELLRRVDSGEPVTSIRTQRAASQ